MLLRESSPEAAAREVAWSIRDTVPDVAGQPATAVRY